MLFRSHVKEQRIAYFAKQLETINDDYDIIIIDVPPTLSVFTDSAIYATDEVIIVLQTQQRSLDGAETFFEYLQQMYIKNLGINFEIEQMEWPVFNSAVEKGEFQIGYMAWGADFNDPISMLSLLKSDAAAIGTGWANDKYDELINLAAKEMDQDKRLEYFAEAEKILLYDEAVLAPVVYPRSNVFRYKYVNELGVTPFGTAGYKYGFTVGR